MSQPTVCLYVTGEPSQPARQAHGTFVDFFGRLFAEHDVRVEVFEAMSGQLPEALDRVDGVVITGSPASVTTPEPWMEAAIELIRQAYQRKTPVLGVCFGHQLMGAAFGGSVIRNPAGWQLATRAVELTARGRRDPLFAGVPESFDALFSHEDIVDPDTLSPLNGIEVLAHNPKARIAAVAAGPCMRGVQFHPEFSAAINRTHVELRRDILTAQAAEHGAPEDHPDAILDTLRDAPYGEQVFHNFLNHFVKAQTLR